MPMDASGQLLRLKTGELQPPGAHDVRPVGSRQRVRVDGKYLARGPDRLRVHGVTYGPFAPAPDGTAFPSPKCVEQDFARMAAAGINSIRTYHLPPSSLLEQADEQDLNVFIDIPWPKHVCFLDSPAAQLEARRLVLQAAERGRSHPCVLAYSIGNEIPPNIVRWHGARRIERFLAELGDVVKQADPGGLVTYANYPSTEYLDLSFLDFATFNVYLHDREVFRRYLFRLQNLVGDKPLLLGELGIDTLRHGEELQAEHLAGHAREVLLMGLAGLFVFSWTDEWHTGGHLIQDWAFGITYADRTPKPAYHALREVFESSVAELLPAMPRVSVVVCSYNGGSTLEQCLRSLAVLDYPDYEVIVVDDGSTDNTSAILADFPAVRAIHQSNHGLSAARNVGLRASSGAIVAYTDSDCFADPHWLTHLVYQLQHSDAAGVGGPNLTPEDGWLAACVAACPGQPTHVLESDQVAEHIPGCNMAFWRAALEAVNGFDSQYRKAGDDVDLCWRLQSAGCWITFAPGAFVWHHRRQGPRAYLRQQAGYGEAEALLRFKHPDRFTSSGDGKWRGVLYGASLQGLCLDKPIMYCGIFGTGLFQCIYQPGPAHWAMLPATLEWHVVTVVVALAALFSPLVWCVVAVMGSLSLLVAALQAAQARLETQRAGPASRLLVMALCYAQPLVRSWVRYRTRLFAYRPPDLHADFPKRGVDCLPLNGVRTVTYWTEEGFDRTELLGLVIAYLNEHGWGKTVDSGWEHWDLEIHCHPWTVVQVCTSQEDHGGNKRLIRVRYRLRLSGTTRILGVLSGVGGAIVFVLGGWEIAGIAAAFVLLAGAVLWWRGTRRASRALAMFDGFAHSLRLLPCDATGTPRQDAAAP
jgi:O-antigen biosynthesis protein